MDKLEIWISSFSTGLIWYNKLNSLDTKKTYLPNLKKYCEFVKMNPDELINLKVEGLKNVNTDKEFLADDLLCNFITNQLTQKAQ